MTVGWSKDDGKLKAVAFGYCSQRPLWLCPCFRNNPNVLSCCWAVSSVLSEALSVLHDPSSRMTMSYGCVMLLCACQLWSACLSTCPHYDSQLICRYVFFERIVTLPPGCVPGYISGAKCVWVLMRDLWTIQCLNSLELLGFFHPWHTGELDKGGQGTWNSWHLL